jgi:hypothetical protein
MPSPDSGPRFPILFISGVGHSGSTLLGSLLNGHPDCAFSGETARMVQAQGPCSCGVELAECELWKPLLPLLTGRDIDDLAMLTPEFYERVRERFGAKVLVDSSKTLAWRMRRSLRSPWRGASVGYIWLVRDSRGVMASHYRSRSGKPVSSVIGRHIKWIKRWDRFMARIGDQGITVFYEDLCSDPRRELERICAFMRIPFDEAMLRPADHQRHDAVSNIQSYMGRGNAIRLDERWREELPAELRSQIESWMRRSRFLRERYLESEASSRSS